MPLGNSENDKWLLDRSRDAYRALVAECQWYHPAVGFPGGTPDRLYFSTKPYIGMTNVVEWIYADPTLLSPPVLDRTLGAITDVGEMDVISELPLSDRTQYDFVGRQVIVRYGDTNEFFYRMNEHDRSVCSGIRRIQNNHYRFNLTSGPASDRFLSRYVASDDLLPGITLLDTVENCLIALLAYDTTLPANSFVNIDDPVYTNIDPSLYNQWIEITIPAGDHQSITYNELFHQITRALPGTFFRRNVSFSISESVEFFEPDFTTPDRILYPDDIQRNAITWIKTDHRKDISQFELTGKTNPYGLYLGNLGEEARTVTVQNTIINTQFVSIAPSRDALQEFWNYDHIYRQVTLSPFVRTLIPGEVVRVEGRFEQFTGMVQKVRYTPGSSDNRIEVLSYGAPV